MSDLRTAAQQALEAMEDFGMKHYENTGEVLHRDVYEALRAALAQQAEPEAYGYASRLAVAIWEKHYKDIAPQWKPLDDLMGVLTQIDNMTSGLTLLAQQAEPVPMPPEQRQRWEELAAMPQQAEPAQDRHRACPTHCCPVHGCKYGHDDCPVAAGAVQPVYPRNNGCESCADEAEPLNLSDRAVQRRLAAQWGYVPAAQAEPVEPVAWKQGNLVTFNEDPCPVLGGLFVQFWDGEEVAARVYANDLKTLRQRCAKVNTAPPQRKPLTEEEIESCRQQGYAHAGLGAPFDFGKAARAVERAVWEKNHG